MVIGRLLPAWFAILCFLGSASASIIWTPSIGADSQPPTDIFSYVRSRTGDLNLSDNAAIESAIQDVDQHVRGNVTGIRDVLGATTNVSRLVRAAYTQHDPSVQSWSGVRTNLSIARAPGGLASGVIALYAEVGSPLTVTQQFAVVQRASETPATVATATAVMVYAIIDALHYRTSAMEGVSAADAQILASNISVLATLHRRMVFTPEGENFTLGFSASDQAVIDAAEAVRADFDAFQAVRGLDVVAQAVDEVVATSLGALPPATRTSPGCGSATYYFALDSTMPFPCLVLVGGPSNNEYYVNPISTDDENRLVLDVGGNDTYKHRAGGATPNNPVQLNVDLEGNDYYNRLASGGAVHGSGMYGIGLLYDRAGNDVYQAKGQSASQFDSVFQGSAAVGAGALIDNAGDDRYLINDPGYTLYQHNTHGQAVAVTGLAILRDGAGRDGYYYNLTTTTQMIAGTGAQAFASAGGAAYLLDYGGDHDTYYAGQDSVQAASSLHGFAVLSDDGGSNSFTVVSAKGCPSLATTDCAIAPVDYVPIAGWSQGYANTNGTSVMITGTGADTHNYTKYADTYLGVRLEGRSLLGAANTSGVAVYFGASGDDHYDIASDGMGFGDAGVAIFTDSGGTDQYLCSAYTCYGYGVADGRGIFCDFGSENDTYADGEQGSVPIVKDNLGLALREGCQDS